MKTYVIAYTTFREIYRPAMFWLVLGVASFCLAAFNYIPYFTLGEDIKMVKDQGLMVIMLAGMVVAIFAASVSIAEELEGKTAITLLSKPVNRREFIVGKFLGIMAGVALMFLLLSIVFAVALWTKVGYEAHEAGGGDQPTFDDRVETLVKMSPGLVLAYFQVTVLCALSVAFSTRFAVHWNITLCLMIYLLGHLAPQMVQRASQIKGFEPVEFMARFFATILPGLEYFSIGPAISTDAYVPWGAYVLPCFVYCVLYTTIALVLAFLMFEDRDLA